jgi:hypothetical protein
MVEYELSFKDAIDGLSGIWSTNLTLDSCFIEYLMQFEVYLNHMISNSYISNYCDNNSDKNNKNKLIDKKELNNSEFDEKSKKERSISKEINKLKKNQNKFAWM